MCLQSIIPHTVSIPLAPIEVGEKFVEALNEYSTCKSLPSLENTVTCLSKLTLFPRRIL